MDVLLSWSEAKRLELSIRDLRASDDDERRDRAIRQQLWQEGRNQLLLYLEDVEAATARVLTDGQGWLFVKWQGKEDWSGIRSPSCYPAVAMLR